MQKQIMFDLYKRRSEELEESLTTFNWMEYTFGTLYVLDQKTQMPATVELASNLDSLFSLPATEENENLVVYIAALHEWAKMAKARMNLMEEIITEEKSTSKLRSLFLENLAKEI
jgi:hypothetical protein